MPGRSFSGASGYRYGFNGKENDNEVKGVEGSQQDYGMRIYDPRLGRFLSVDPLAREYPHAAPCSFAENGPIENIDRDGEERLHFTVVGYNKDGNVVLQNPVKEDIIDRKFNWKTLSWENDVNSRIEYVIHTGVVHTGAVNGSLYHVELTYVYSIAEDFIEDGMKITRQDIIDLDNFYNIGDKVVASIDNFHQNYKESRPGKTYKKLSEENLNDVQKQNLKRFNNKKPANSTDVEINENLLTDGIEMQTTSPGEVPGSKAVYTKTMDKKGNTIKMDKITYDPKGKEIHNKNKLKK